NGIQVRADEVEGALVEDEARAGGDVGGRGEDHRSLPAPQVAERGAVEEDLVIEIGGELGAPPAFREQRSPVARAERTGDEFALHVALEEALLVVLEQLVAI